MPSFLTIARSGILVAAASAALATFAAPASAFIAPNDPCTVFAHWNPVTPGDPQPTMIETTPCPPATGLFGNTATLFFEVPNGNGSSLHWQIVLPNWIDELNMKKLWIEVTTQIPATEFDIQVIASDTPMGGTESMIPGTLHGIEQLGNTVTTGFLAHFWIRPNPDWETIDILCCKTVTAPPIITAIWVHTVSMDVPEPAGLTLLGAGLLGLAALRRRRHLA